MIITVYFCKSDAKILRTLYLVDAPMRRTLMRQSRKQIEYIILIKNYTIRSAQWPRNHKKRTKETKLKLIVTDKSIEKRVKNRTYNII